MKKEIEEWIAFCNGTKDFDKSHFYTLLMRDDEDGVSPEESSIILQFFPHADELIRRLNTYFSDINSVNEIDNVEEYIINSVQKDIKEKGKTISNSKMQSYIKNDIELTKVYEKVEDALLDDCHADYIALIEDYLLDFKYSEEPKVYALFEAFYGLTNNYQLVWYLASPLLQVDINFDNYYNLWKIGSEYVVTNNGIIAYKHPLMIGKVIIPVNPISRKCR